MRIVAMSHLLRSVFSGLALAFWGNELQGKDYFITVGGGYTPQQNQASLEANVLFFQKILSEKHPQPLRHSVFFADGHDEKADLQVLSTVQPKSEPLRDLLSRLHRRGPPDLLSDLSSIETIAFRKLPDPTRRDSFIRQSQK